MALRTRSYVVSSRCVQVEVTSFPFADSQSFFTIYVPARQRSHGWNLRSPHGPRNRSRLPRPKNEVVAHLDTLLSNFALFPSLSLSFHDSRSSPPNASFALFCLPLGTSSSYHLPTNLPAELRSPSGFLLSLRLPLTVFDNGRFLDMIRDCELEAVQVLWQL